MDWQVHPLFTQAWRRRSQQQSRRQGVARLALATFYLTLLQAPLAAQLLSQHRGARHLACSQQRGFITQRPQLSFVWQQWQSFISVVRALIWHRCTLLLVCTAAVRLLAEAVSWQSWNGSSLGWILCRALLQKPAQRLQSDLIPQDACFLLLSPTLTPALAQRLRQTPLPLLGGVGAPDLTRVLWATPGLPCSTLEAQGALLAVCWGLLRC